MNRFVKSEVKTDLQPDEDGGCSIEHVLDVTFEADGRTSSFQLQLSERDLYTMKMTLKDGVLEGQALMKQLLGVEVIGDLDLPETPGLGPTYSF